MSLRSTNHLIFDDSSNKCYRGPFYAADNDRSVSKFEWQQNHRRRRPNYDHVFRKIEQPTLMPAQQQRCCLTDFLCAAIHSIFSNGLFSRCARCYDDEQGSVCKKNIFRIWPWCSAGAAYEDLDAVCYRCGTILKS